MNRISPVLDRLIGIEDPDELMTEIRMKLSVTLPLLHRQVNFLCFHMYQHQLVDL